MTRWLSVAQAARRLHLSQSYVRQLIRYGTIPAVKAGTGRTSPYRVTEQAISDYLAGHPPVTTEEWVAAQLAAAPPFTPAQLAVLRPICQRMGEHMRNATPAHPAEAAPAMPVRKPRTEGAISA